MSSVYVWNLTCSTEAAKKEVISSATPATCPTDSAHTIDADSVRVVRTHSQEDVVVVKEEGVATGGHFQTKTVKVSTAADSTATATVSWKYPINVLAAYYVSEETHRGDNIELVVGENTTVGVLAANASAGATVLTVNSTTYMYVGGYIRITDGTNTDDLGEILDVDSANNQITVDIATTNSFTAGPTTHIQISNKMVKDYEIGGPFKMTVGSSKIGGSYVPANVVTTIRYTNKSLTDAKELIFRIEYLY